MKEAIEQALNDALNSLLERDAHLLRTDVNERTISHRLAGYLEPIFSGWDIDCEYNRNHHDKKTLEIPRRNVPNDDTHARTVYPDIIVHKRNTDENLLVIEMKKTTSQEADAFDLLKLKAFKEQLGYKYAVFVKVRTKVAPAVETIKWL